MKTALGYDCHALEKKNDSFITIAGVKIESQYAVKAFSDGDVVYHAIADALSSSILRKSIGELFSDRDEKNRDRDSSEFVKETFELTARPKISYIDIIVILEEPIIAPYTEKMRQNIASLLDMDLQNISIRGKRREDDVKKISAMLTMNIC